MLVSDAELCYQAATFLIAASSMSGKSTSESPGERIAKVIARAGLASRREAEAWIAAGRVAVNGATISSPALNVGPADSIVVNGEPLPRRERTRLFLYNKSRGLVTTNSDPQGRPTIFAALPKHLPRLISIGRLDLNTEGLLLLTNDGALARVLELPATAWLRSYRVRAYGRVTQEALDGLKRGVTIDGIRYGAVEATLDREQGSNVWLTFAIREGKNREVRNVLRHLGLQVNRLIRVSFGPFELGALEDSAVSEVETSELRKQLGEKIAAEAQADFEGPLVVDNPRHIRHPEARGRPRRTPKGDRPSSFDARRGRPRQDDKAKPKQDDRYDKKKVSRRDRTGGPRPSRPRPK